jgi:hypothetical protein
MRFLASLIARHRPDHAVSMPRLEPRLPSRFEPVTDAAGPERMERDVAIDAVLDREVVTPLAPRPAPRPPRVDAERFEDLRPELRSLRSALSAVRATVDVPAVATAAVVPVTEAVRLLETPRAPAVGDAPGPTGESTPAPPPRTVRNTFLEPAPDRRQPAPAAPAIRIDRAPTAPSGPPTVHVSIGRVDVRAIVTPTASPARPPVSVNRLSLEEYLRGRPRGAR